MLIGRAVAKRHQPPRAGSWGISRHPSSHSLNIATRTSPRQHVIRVQKPAEKMTDLVAQIETKSSPVTPSRTLYVLVYPSPLFAAHWSFWLPYLDISGREARVGDRIHATGD